MSNKIEEKQCNYTQELHANYPHTAVLSSKQEEATIVEQQRNYLYTVDAAVGAELQITSILSLHRPTNYFYYSDNSYYNTPNIGDGNYYL